MFSYCHIDLNVFPYLKINLNVLLTYLYIVSNSWATYYYYYFSLDVLRNF